MVNDSPFVQTIFHKRGYLIDYQTKEGFGSSRDDKKLALPVTLSSRGISKLFEHWRQRLVKNFILQENINISSF